MLLTSLMAAAAAIAALAPESPVGRLLIYAPARWLATTTPRRVALRLLASAILIGFALSAPELAALIGLADLSLLAEASAAVLLVSTAARVSNARRFVVGGVARAPPVVRHVWRRARRMTRTTPARGDRGRGFDDDPDGAFAFAGLFA